MNKEEYFCVCVKRIMLWNCLYSPSPSYFSDSRIQNFGNVNRYSWYWKSLNIVDGGGEFSFFQGIQVRSDIGIDISISITPMTTKFDVHLGELTQMRPIKQVLVTSSRQDHVTNHYISTTAVPMATKLYRIVTNPEWLLFLVLLYSLVMWSWEIRWQTKNTIPPMSECLWQPNFPRWWLTLRRSFSCYSSFWSRGLEISYDKLKTYLQYHSVCGHHTWENGD